MDFSQRDANLKEKVKNLTQSPGVYIMKNSAGKIIYIGKAKSLKNRVSQYFTGTHDNIKVAKMADNIYDFDFIVTDSEFEALVLECNLIKIHRPKYNVLLKDDKNYPFIKITINEQYPKIMLSRSIKKDGARYFGPYSSSKTVNDTIWLLRRMFMISNCKLDFPRDIKKSRPCLNYHINRCIGPCTGDITSEHYREIFKEITMFLEGDLKTVLENLNQKMYEASENLEFEKARTYRDRINYINKINDRQKVMLESMKDCDALGSYFDGEELCFCVLFIRYGKLVDKKTIRYPNISAIDQGELYSQFIKQFYNQNSYIPKEILIASEIEDRELLEKYISEFAKKKIEIRTPQKGQGLKLVNLAQNNAKEELQNINRAQAKGKQELMELAAALSLDKMPVRIEAYDIANMGDNSIVGGMVVYEYGMPQKSEYRKFKMKYNTTQDDYQSMKEMIYRRFLKAEQEAYENKNAEGLKFASLPDLILIDGALGHVNAVKQMLYELGMDIPVFGMAKNKNHRVNRIVSDKGEVLLKPGVGYWTLIGNISQEVHRYTISYHKKLRQNKSFESSLNNIKGLGEVKKRLLLERFKNIQGIRNATLEQIAEVKGINISLAKSIKTSLLESEGK